MFYKLDSVPRKIGKKGNALVKNLKVSLRVS